MGELREETGMKKHPRMKVVGSRLGWTGHIQRMNEGRLTKRAWKTEESGRRRERPKLRWRDIVKRHSERAEVNSREWERLAEDDGEDSSKGQNKLSYVDAT